MKFIYQNSKNEFILNIYVKTNSKSQEILEPYDDDYLTVLLCSKPIHNKANKELLNMLKDKLKISSAQIVILSGLKKSNKKIRITFKKNTTIPELKQKLFS